MKNQLNLNYLETFFSLVETSSFSKTSQNLKITQSAISKRIKSLEEDLDVQLFIRTRQEVSLSPQGEKFCKIIKPLYQEMNLQLQNFCLEKDELRGKMCFACFPEIGEKIFIKALSGFKKLHPLLQLEVKFLKTSEIIQGVKDGSIDIGIVSEALIQESVRSYFILEEEIVLATSPKNVTKKLMNLTHLPFVTYRQNHQLLGKYLKTLYPKIQLNKLTVEFSVSSHRAMIEVIKQHDYYAALPLLSIQNEIEEGSLIVVGQKSLKSKLHLIHLDLEYPIQRVEALKQFLLDYIYIK